MNSVNPSLFDFEVGAVIAGRYEVLRLMNVGGTAQLYEVRDSEGSHDRLALKLLSSALSDEESRGRVRREIELIRPLNHPNLVRVYECGTLERGRLFLTMELVEGESLYEQLQAAPGNRLEFADAVRVLAQVADALHYAHTNHVLHRDLKPENIFMTLDGTPKLGDFGAVYPTSQDKRLTKAGATFGTPGYLSPEQLSQRALDARVDVYAFGILAFEIVSGEQPFVSESDMATILTNQARLTNLARFPFWFRDFVQTCTELEPDRRFGSMAEVLELLRRHGARNCGGAPILKRLSQVLRNLFSSSCGSS